MPIPKKYNKDFFKTWSSDMAYILGFMYADGNIVETKRGNQYVAIYTADRELLVAIAKTMQSEHKVAQRNASAGCVYRIQIGSRVWFADLGMLGLWPNKTKRMKLPHIPKEYFGDFVRGYFDGDGNIWVGFVHKERKTALQTIQVAFTSQSTEYLRSLHQGLQRQGIVGGSLYISKKKHFARLAFSVTDALKIYEIMYNCRHKLYLKRKKVVFEQFMKLRS
jgi:intein/homing endonuclease